MENNFSQNAAFFFFPLSTKKESGNQTTLSNVALMVHLQFPLLYLYG